MPLFCDTADTAGMIFLCTEQAEQYVIQSKVYKGWLGQGPGLEALSLMGGRAADPVVRDEAGNGLWLHGSTQQARGHVLQLLGEGHPESAQPQACGDTQ